MVLHRYPLHRISYCADDKSDKRMFTFIAKAADTNKHFCYVFGSDKNVRQPLFVDKLINVIIVLPRYS